MRKHLKVIFSLLTLTSVLVLPYFVFAQTPPASNSKNTGMVEKLDRVAGGGGYVIMNSSLTEVVGLVIQAFLGLLGAIFIILMVYAGYTWMTAAGNEPKIEKAQGMIKTAVIGLIITLSSWAIWSLILTNFITAR
ncbi:MAG: pilin [Patescibacteria group bacterium]